MDNPFSDVGRYVVDKARELGAWLAPAQPVINRKQPELQNVIDKSSSWQQDRLAPQDAVPTRQEVPDFSRMPEPVYASAKSLPKPTPSVHAAAPAKAPGKAISPFDYDFANTKNYQIGGVAGANALATSVEPLSKAADATRRPDESWNKQEGDAPAREPQVKPQEPLPKLGRGADAEVAELQQNIKRYGEVAHQPIKLGNYGQRGDGVDGRRGRRTEAAEKEVAKSLGLEPGKHSTAELNGKLRERIEGIEKTPLSHDGGSVDHMRKLAARAELPREVSGGQPVDEGSKSPSGGGGRQATNEVPLAR